MSDNQIKPIILGLLHHAYRDEVEMINSLTEDERTQPGSPDQWSAKDIISHIGTWRQRQADKLAAAVRGEEPPRWNDDDSVNQINADDFEEHKDDSWQEVRQEAEQAYGNLVGQIHSMDGADLMATDRYPWQQGKPLWKVTLANGLWHPYEHLTKFYQRRGDTRRAVEINEGLVDALRKANVPDSLQGDTLYNMACMYALSEQGDKALELLTEAMRRNPDLKGWAKQDPDLKSLSSRPEFQTLIAE